MKYASTRRGQGAGVYSAEGQPSGNSGGKPPRLKRAPKPRKR